MPIFWTAVDKYAERNGIDGEQFDLLLKFVSVIDDAYRDQVETDRKAAMEAAKKKPENPEA